MSASDSLGPQFREFGARDQTSSPQGGVSNGGWKPSRSNVAAAVLSSKPVTKERVARWPRPSMS